MKIFSLKILISVFIFACIYLLSGKTANNVACARHYGPGETCPGNTSITVGSLYPGGTDSVDVKIEIRGNGIPPNQHFKVDAGAPVCDEVKCLARSGSTDITYGSGIGTGTIDTIGCSTGSSPCNDELEVNAYFAANPTGLQCTVYAGTSTGGLNLTPYQNTQSDSIKSRNGTAITFQFYFDCAAPGITPTPAPACPVTKPVPAITCNPDTKTVTCTWGAISTATDWNADLTQGSSNIVCRSQWFTGGSGSNGACTTNTTNRTVTYTNAANGSYTCDVGAFYGQFCSQVVGSASCNLNAPTPTPAPSTPITSPPPGYTPPPGVTVPPTNTPNPSCPVPQGAPVVTVTCSGCNGGGTTPTPPASTVTPPATCDNVIDFINIASLPLKCTDGTTYNAAQIQCPDGTLEDFNLTSCFQVQGPTGGNPTPQYVIDEANRYCSTHRSASCANPSPTDSVSTPTPTPGNGTKTCSTCTSSGFDYLCSFPDGGKTCSATDISQSGDGNNRSGPTCQLCTNVNPPAPTSATGGGPGSTCRSDSDCTSGVCNISGHNANNPQGICQ